MHLSHRLSGVFIGIITIALSFAVGIVASLIRPEPEAAAKFAEVSRRMHLGPTGSDTDAS